MTPIVRARRTSSLFALIALEGFFVASTAGAPGEAIARDDTTRFVETTASLAPQASPRQPESVVMIVLDGVRWQEVYQGADLSIARPRGLDVYALRKPEALMPNLHRLMDHGVALGAPGHGEPVTATGTFVSLPGYIEMFTGQRHVPCADNDCRKPHMHTFLDELRADGPKEDVAVVSSWPAVARASALDPTKLVESTGRDYGFNRESLRFDSAARMNLWSGDAAFPYPGDDEHYRPDYFTGKIAVRYLAEKKPSFLFIGLGDGDELAHRNDYHGYLNALEQEDKIIGDVMHTLDAMGDRGKRTTILVTADHGRCDSFVSHGAECPESGRTWIVAGGGQVPQRGFVDLTTERHLADIAPTIRILTGLPQGDDTKDAGVAMTEILGDSVAIVPATVAAN